MTASKPEMLILGGPNGAGKTTLAKRFASSLNAEYIGADQIAFQLCPENPLSVRIQSAEAFVGKILELIDSDQTFVIETTLSGKTFDQYVKRATNRGFQTTLAFAFLDSDEIVRPPRGIACPYGRTSWAGGGYSPQIQTQPGKYVANLSNLGR